MKTNLQFLKDLIDSDFLLLSYNKTFSFKIKQITSIKHERTFFLDLLESNKSLKQFIRNLQYLTKGELCLLQIVIKNAYLECLFKECLLESGLENKFHTMTMFSELKSFKKTGKMKKPVKIKETRNMLLFVGNTSKEVPHNVFFEKNLLLVNEIHSEISLKI